jgi:hypothetical protein
VAVALTQSQCRVDARLRSKLDALKRSLSELPGASADAGLDARLADVVVAWNVFRHFYPYWAEAGVDWEQRLAPQLRVSAAASTRDERRDALRLLVADARDGHGRVADTLDATQRAALPVRFDVVEEQIVVSASEEADSVPVGALVREIGGVASHVRLATEMRLVSGAEQWRRARALLDLAMGPKGEATLLAFDAGDGRREATLRYTERQPPLEQRPPELAQLPGDVLYVDLTRATTSLVTASLERLAAARGIVFDLRGYPTDGGKLILPHLLAESESDRWMHVAKLVGPFGSSAGWHGLGWDLEPRSPRFTGKIVFLTDGRAISYAESVMGYVRDRKLATIVGGPTAGTNGNVATFNLPGGFRVGFTGMRVTRHDGESPFHLLGVEPNIPAARTLSGLRAGRDEVLERGLAVIRQR